MRNVFPEYKSDVILGNGELQLDPMSYNVFYKKREINLSPREFEVRGRVLFLLPEYRRKSNLIREYRKDQ